MEECAKYLNHFGVENELVVASVHCTPDKVMDLSANTAKSGFGLIITAPVWLLLCPVW